jgi:hypothetical protein
MADARDDELVGRDQWGDEADERLAEAKPSQAQATESPDAAVGAAHEVGVTRPPVG